MRNLPPEEGLLPIAAVEQSTGIARATLRIWERRYGFPMPGRDERGERAYGAEQVEKLRLIGALMARGHRPGGLVQLATTQLQALAGPDAAPSGATAAARSGQLGEPLLELLRQPDATALLRALQDEIAALGLAVFVTQRMAVLNEMVGTAWAQGRLQIFEEHLYTDTVQQAVRGAMSGLPVPPADNPPRVVLATFPNEPHGLGLLMVQAMLTLEGCTCPSLGVRLPLEQIRAAAMAYRADVVGLSFTAAMPGAQVLRGLEQLRGDLPPHVAIWAGGSSAALRRALPGVVTMRSIAQVPAAVAAWRAAHPGAGTAGVTTAAVAAVG